MNADARLVLVVEGDVQSANLLSTYLTRGWYRSHLAAVGREVLEKAFDALRRWTAPLKKRCA